MIRDSQIRSQKRVKNFRKPLPACGPYFADHSLNIVLRTSSDLCDGNITFNRKYQFLVLMFQLNKWEAK
jgi:hypothetical protein